ncbi:MAG TPA: hypothetical protein VF607_13375 [Verrucomicrobiae bacterium]
MNQSRNNEQAMLKQHAPMVGMMVQQFARREPSLLSHEALHSVGLMALLDAVRQYPASSKVSFENFARVQIHRTLYSEINRTKQWFDASPAHLAPTQSFFA